MEHRPIGDLVVGICFILFGLCFFIPSLTLGIRGPEAIPGPGPGFFPAMCSGFVMFWGALIVIRSLKHGSVDFFGSDPEQRSHLKKIGCVVLAFAAFTLLWVFTEFFIAAAVLCLLLNLIFRRSLKFNLIFTVAYIGLLYLIFEKLLDIQFTI